MNNFINSITPSKTDSASLQREIGHYYVRYPVAHKNKIYMISQDKIWRWYDGQLTTLGEFDSTLKQLRISPCGNYLSFYSTRESNGDLYRYNLLNNTCQRITYFDMPGVQNAGYTEDGIICSAPSGVTSGQTLLYSFSEPGVHNTLPYLNARRVAAFGEDVVIQKYGYGMSSWVGYEGGLAGTINLCKNGFVSRLAPCITNAHEPIFIGEEIFFVGDTGSGYHSLLKYTKETDSHKIVNQGIMCNVEDISVWDKTKIIFQKRGSIYVYDSETNKTESIDLEDPGFTIKHEPESRTVDSEEITSIAINDSGSQVAIGVRGHILSAKLQKPFVQHTEDIRHRFATYLDENRLLCVKEDAGNATAEVYDTTQNTLLSSNSLPIGMVSEVAAIDKDKLVIENHRGNLYLTDLAADKTERIAKARDYMSGGFDISPDKKWIVYSMMVHNEEFCKNHACLYLYNLENQTTHQITDGLGDYSPSFSKDGQYIYFLSDVEPAATSDPSGYPFYRLSFKHNTMICAIKVNYEVGDPFKPWERSSTDTEIRLDEIVCVKSSLPKGKYSWLVSVSDTKLLVNVPGDPNEVHVVDLTKSKKSLLSKADMAQVSHNKEWLIIHVDDKLRVTKTTEAFSDDDDDKTYKNHGWIELDEARITINPKAEWRNMLRNAWWLCKDLFWNPKPDHIDWDDLLARYEALLPKVQSRSDLNEILRAMGSELRVSHLNVIKKGEIGSKRHPPQGYLGGKFEWDNGYRITAIDQTEEFPGFKMSPLLLCSPAMRVGDIILAVDGERCKQSLPIEHYLRYKGDKLVSITYRRGDKVDSVCIKALERSSSIRYRAWVNKNRQYVHENSGGKIGYVHVSSMMKSGFEDFYRGYAQEVQRNGLIIDVRDNPGGHCMTDIMMFLQNTQLGADVIRDQIYAGPHGPNQGRMALLCSGLSGSGGDAITHEFKMRKLGTVIGERTWGGLLAVRPQHRLIDGGLISHPEYGVFYRDVGLGIENYGATPDIEIESKVFIDDEDAQLKKAIEILLAQGIDKSINEEIIQKFNITLEVE